MGLFILVAFLATEIWLLLLLIDAFGGLPVFLWMLGTASLGVFALRQQGLRVLQALQRQAAGGELPALSLFDGLLVFVSGLLLILPGVLSDLLGLSLLALRGLRHLLSGRLQKAYAQRHPELRRPVTLEGHYTRVD